jgi:hypothetical protein
MAIIPNAQQFHTLSSTVDTTERGSALANASREVYTMQDIKDSAGPGYKIYAAILSQAGTNAPVVTELKNNTGATFTWTRFATGQYRAQTNISVFTANKTVGIFTNGQTIQLNTVAERLSDTFYQLETAIGSSLVDDFLSNAYLEILIYD